MVAVYTLCYCSFTVPNISQVLRGMLDSGGICSRSFSHCMIECAGEMEVWNAFD